MSFRAYLEGLGYALAERGDAFVEILAVRDGERWLGRGMSVPESLDDLRRQMFPSAAAAALLDAALGHAALPESRDAHDSDAMPASAVMAEVIPEAAKVDDDRRAETTEVLVAASTPAAVAALPAPDVDAFNDHSARDVAATVSAQLSPEGPAAVQTSAVPEAPARDAAPMPFAATAVATPKYDVAGEVAAVGEILDEIEDRMDELGELAPEHQRLLMLLFICRARASVERAPSSEVHAATARVAKRLSDAAKLFWPGSVRALQMGVMPRDALPKSRLRIEPRTWEEAADGADLMLGDRQTLDERTGRDAYGYIDDTRARVARETSDEEVSNLMKQCAAALVTLDGPSFDVVAAERVAAKLRSIRRRVAGREWGALMGKLRQRLSLLGSEGTTLRNYVDAGFAPPRTWRDLFDSSPAQRATPVSSASAASSASSQLAASAPPEDAAAVRASVPAAGCSDAVLGEWIIRALAVLDVASASELLRPFGARVATTANTLATLDRRGRRKLREVQRALGLTTDDSASDASSGEGRAVASEGDGESDDGSPADEDDEATDVIDVAGAEFQALVARVRASTAGRTAMFISNREDPDLAARLSELLGLTLTWTEATPRRIEAACEKISRNAFDYVLSATGFQAHKADAAVARAARATGVKFVRVNRGRPVACVLALARELGLAREEQSASVATTLRSVARTG